MRRSAPPRAVPPPLELECLKALWRLGEGTVKEVQAALNPTRTLAYTTVMTLLDRLARKGAVARRKAGRAFIYSANLDADVVRRAAVQELVDCLFGGSQEQLVAFLTRAPVAQPATLTPAADGDLDPSLL
ncbi:MAG: BlaI/MecI/CopY family transcriptional regulator [Bryobacterales bacterium]|nr:BlaI/MecI/CopY family transcriptional regulator [Bryobacteraceae bacterium]MDW8353641.1 BlaI/MecI/CopY family transcriptional regulator [Bryobacterales bacterium]